MYRESSYCTYNVHNANMPLFSLVLHIYIYYIHFNFHETTENIVNDTVLMNLQFEMSIEESPVRD